VTAAKTSLPRDQVPEQYGPGGGLADRAEEAAAMRLLVQSQTQLGYWESCVQTCGRLLPILRELDDQAGECDTLTVQAQAFAEIGLCDDALEALTGAHQIATALDDRQLLLAVLNRLATTYSSLGDFQRADELLHEALAHADELGDHERFCVLNNLADNAASTCEQDAVDSDDDYEQVVLAGLDHAETARPLADSPYREVMILDNLGWLLGLAGQYGRALRTLERAGALATHRGYLSLELATRKHEAGVLMRQGDAAAALPRLAECLRQAEQTRELPVEVALVLETSAAYEQLGDFEQALAWHKRYVGLERQLRSARAAIRARMLAHHVELDRARSDAENARHRSSELEAEKQALVQLTRELDQRANRDALTRLSNRHHLERVLPVLFGSEDPLSVAVVDIDHFKQVNDTFGHGLGDAVLVEVAGLLCRQRAPSDLVARLGGEEFVVVMPDVDGAPAVDEGQRIRQAVEGHDWSRLRAGLKVTVSIGVCERGDAADVAELLQRADACMYRAKRAGRNRVRSGLVVGADPIR
jgi:diguanylate cyclase (GGDEF)-like protein